MNKVFRFLGHFPFKVQFFIGYLPLSLVVVYVMIWSNENLNDAFDQVTLLDETAMQSELLADINLDLLELQRTVIVYSYIGYEGVLRKVEKLEKGLDLRFEGLVFEDQAMADRLYRLGSHYHSYKSVFKDIVEQKHRLNDFQKKVIPLHLEKMLSLVEKMKEQVHSDPERLVKALQLEGNLMKAHTNMKAYFLTPDSVPMTDSRALLSQSADFLEEGGSWAELPYSVEILNELRAYQKDLNAVVNLYRGYLFSVNVVLAGKSSEMALLGRELSELYAEKTTGFRNTISQQISLVSKNNNSFMIAVVLLCLAISFVMAHGLASPLHSVSRALLGLANNEKDIIIPATDRRDEVGDLATAAKAFKEIVDEFASQTEMMRLQKNELQLIFDHVPARIWYKDEQNNIIRLNEAAARFMGGTVADFEGRNALELFPDMDEQLQKKDLAVIRSEKPSLGIIEKTTSSDGEVFWNRTDKVPYRDRRSGKSTLLILAQDITGLKMAEEALRESEERYDLAVEGSSVGLWDWNIVTSELYWSPRFLEILGIEKKGFVPEFAEFPERLHLDDKDSILQALNQHVADGSEYNVEYRLLHNKGHYVWIHARGQALWDEEGNAYRMAGSVVDISANKQMQLEREKLLEDVTDSNERLQHFAYICSHDLQEPLRMISSFSEILEEHLKEVISQDEEAKQYFTFVMDGAVRAQLLIKDILEYSRLDNSTSQLEKVSLNETLLMVQENMKDMVQRTGGTLNFIDLPEVYANKTQLYQLLLNLVNNGFKYCKPGVPPVVDVSCREREDDWVMAVADNGIGIKESFYKKIFEIFERLHSNKEYPGTGLGLAICQKIVERHHGKIWLESREGEGSTFYFSWPKVEVAEVVAVDASSGTEVSS